MFDHFIAAQDPVYPGVLQQLRAGRKQGHWMWFIFPQLTALGRSVNAEKFGIANLEEAKAYAAHALVGGRLRQCVSLANAIEGRSALEAFGSPDDLKLCSCLTLFWVATGEQIFQDGLQRFYDGQSDRFTLDLLNRSASAPD